MKLKGKVELEDGGWAEVVIHQMGQAWDQPCAFITRLSPFDGKILCVRLEFVRVDEEEAGL